MRKMPAAREAGFGVEAGAQVFVGGVDIKFAIDGEEKGGDDDQGQGHGEIVLDEAHAVGIALAGGGEEEGDGGGLGGHDGDADDEPGVLFAAEVVMEVAAAAGAEDAVEGDAEDAGEEDEVVEGVQTKALVKRVSRRTMATKVRRTKV